MFQQLLISSRFVPVFIVQFFSALSDNFIKNALVILVLFKLGSEQGAVLVTLAGAALIMPMFILSALAGELADKFDKARVARWIKVAEIPVAAIAGLGFVLNSISLLFLSIVLFGFGAALFGPIKYGILPDHLERRELPAANALVEGATFLAILLGTILGGLAMVEGSDGANVVPSFAIASVILGFAIIGWLSARAIQQTGAAAPELRITKNPVRSTIDRLRELAADRRLWVGGLITSWFWLAGIVALSLLPTLIKGHLGGGKEMITLGLCVFTVGIAFGSYLAARASRQRPNLALVPIGALLMGLFCLDIGWTVLGRTAAENSLGFSNLWQSINGVRVMLDLFGMSAAGGLFIVPAFASVQMWAPADKRARVIAAVNILNATFMTTATLAVAGLQYSGWQSSHLFMALGAANLVAVILVLRAWGRQGVQDVAKLLFKVFYRLEVKGIENLPEDGECAIIAPNHVSLLDGPVMHSIMPSYAAFAIDHGIAQAWWVKPFLPLIKAYTLDPTRPLAARALIKEVKAGQTLVIFPEGRLTVTGGLMKVYDGTAMIADKTDAWIVPVRIDGLERSPWSYMRKSQTKKVWFPKVTVTILPARKLEVDATLRGKARRQTAGLALQDVMVNTAVECANIDKTLFQALLDAKETRDTGKTMLEDPLMTKLSYSRLLTGTQMLARKMKKPLSGSENIGVMLPNTAGVAVTFFALQSLGKVPAMLNYTAGARNILAACKAAEVKVVLTSRSFIDKARLQEVEIALNKKTKLVYLEDIRADITTLDKIRALLGSKKAIVKRRPNDPAAILFTSGSEGTPKGVVLSHRNLLANSIQSLTRIAAHGDDKVFNVLPVFHSFGLTAGLIMPLIGGIPIYLYPSPLHYRIVPELVYQTNATILFGTDTFLNGYARVAHPYDFHSVRMILAGAEAVKQRTREVYMERFGVRILEGYGVTETAPVLAINTPLASKSGTVGRLSPLMEYRLEAVPGIEEGGRLHVRGPNVMLGYLRAENPGVLETLQDGWHDTGDIVEIDDQGYITIKGRAKRFAKIAGEMVSLSAVEALAATLSPTAMSVVISMPDLRKGERLVLVTTDKEITRQRFQQMARAKGASDLMVPADVMVVDHVPVLGSGKADYVAAAELVKAEMAGTTGAAQALAT